MPSPRWTQLQCKNSLQCIRIVHTVHELKTESSKKQSGKEKVQGPFPSDHDLCHRQAYTVQRQLRQQIGDDTFTLQKKKNMQERRQARSLW